MGTAERGFWVGDQAVPNPQHSALIRDAGGLGQATLFRADRIAAASQLLGEPAPASYNPHTFLADSQSRAAYLISAAANSKW